MGHLQYECSGPKPAPMTPPEPDAVPIILYCPMCQFRHIDVGEFAVKKHHTHACQNCGHCWRPAIVPTVGVQFLPGFKNKAD
jgi:rubredoxin